MDAKLKNLIQKILEMENPELLIPTRNNFDIFNVESGILIGTENKKEKTKTKYVYNENGLLRERITFDKKGELILEKSFEYSYLDNGALDKQVNKKGKDIENYWWNLRSNSAIIIHMNKGGAAVCRMIGKDLLKTEKENL